MKRRSHHPRIPNRSRKTWLGLGLLTAFWAESCTSSDELLVRVAVNGLDSSHVSERVLTTLNGKASQNELDRITRRLDSFDLKLPQDVTGTLGITVSAQDGTGCSTRAGTTSVDVAGPGSYSTSVDLGETVGCQLQVVKQGSGSGSVRLSTGTKWSFYPPQPPQTQCPVDLFVPASESMVFPVGTKVFVTADTPTDTAPDSYLSRLEGCTQTSTGCEVTIGPDTNVVSIFLERNVACSTDQFCWEHPRPQGLHLRRIFGSTADNIWAAGDGTLLHWEGTFWSIPRQARMTHVLTGILSDAANNGVFVAKNGEVRRLANQAWVCPEKLSTNELHAVWGTNPGDFWVAGSGGTLVHWDGQKWIKATNIGTVTLRAIRGSSASSIWAVGDNSTVFHYDGSTWSKVSLPGSVPNTLSLNGVWVSPEDEAWIVGDGGTSLSISGGKVTSWTTGTSNKLNDLFAFPGQYKWAVGDGGIILRHDGKSWSPVHSGTSESLNSLWGASPTDIWAVGNYGTQLRFNGVFWSVVSSIRKTQNLHAIGAAPTASGNTGAVVAVGEQGTVLRHGGADWLIENTLSGALPRTLRAVSASSNSIWIAGDAGTIIMQNEAHPLLPYRSARG